jgi:segregation and condensation protein B
METIKEKKRCLRAIEAILFSQGAPLELSRLHALLSLEFSYSPTLIAQFLEEMTHNYEEEKRGFRLQKRPDGYLLTSSAEFAPLIEKLGKSHKEDKLSPPMVEVLSIVAFKGPLSKAQIDHLRGVDSGYCLQNLQERGLVEKRESCPSDKKRAVSLYKITPQFLAHMGIDDPKKLLNNSTLQP